MGDPKVKYSWSNHLEQSKGIWTNIYNSNSFADVTLVCNDKKQISAHKVILSAFSPVINKILKQNISVPHPWIYLRGIDYDELDAIIKFMYLGEVSVEQSKVSEFFEIAEDLEVTMITTSQTLAKDDTQLADDHVSVSSFETLTFSSWCFRSRISSSFSLEVVSSSKIFSEVCFPSDC